MAGETGTAAVMPDTTAPTPPVFADAEEKRRVLNRLKRSYGQLGAVIKAVESDAGCRDVVTQLAAVSSAVERAGFAIIACRMRESLDPAREDAETPTVEEFEKLFMMLS